MTDNLISTAVEDLPPIRVLVQDRTFRAELRRSLVSRVTVAPSTTKDVSANIELPIDGKQVVRFLSAPEIKTADWKAALGNTVSAQSTPQQIREAIAALAERVVMSDREATPPPFARWMQRMKDSLVASASQGVVVGGTVAEDVRVLYNRIENVIQGVHVALSHADPKRAGPPDVAGTVVVRANRITLLLPPNAVRQRHGVFVGSCESLVVDDNRIRAVRPTGTSNHLLDGIRVFGVLGPFLVIERNLIEGCDFGIEVVPANPAPAKQALWRVLHNVAPNARSAVSNPRGVPFLQPGPPWNVP